MQYLYKYKKNSIENHVSEIHDIQLMKYALIFQSDLFGYFFN